MQHITKFSFILLLFFFANTILAQNEVQPPRISIQGTLKDANGAALDDGTYPVTFKLYTSIVGGAAQWEEAAPIVISGGIYSHYLGSIEELDATVFDTTLFLGVVVNGLELSPRTELTYAPYTFASYTALQAQQVICSGAVGDVKFSILNETQFAEENGDCWVKMDGGNMFGSKLAEILLTNDIPDASGLFLRAHEWNDGNDPDRTPSTAVASLQEDQFQDHQHDVDINTDSKGSHTHGLELWRWHRSFTGSDTNNAYERTLVVGPKVADKTYSKSYTTQPSGAHTHRVDGWTAGAGHETNTDVKTGTETRSKNLNLYVYIRVN